MIKLKKRMCADVHFFLRGKHTASQETPCVIYAQVEVSGKRSTSFSTKLKIPKKYWMAARSRNMQASTWEMPVSGSYPLARSVNDHIVAIRKYADEACRILEAVEQPVTLEAIKELILNPKPVKQPKKMIDAFDELREAVKAMGREKSTMLTYRTRRNNFYAWLKETNRLGLMITDFRFVHFEALQAWMVSAKNKDGTRRWCRNTINKLLTTVNQLLDYSVNKEYIPANPIGKMFLEYDPTQPPQYLQLADRNRIYGCHLTSLEKERDVAVFLYNTGLSFTDYLSLDNSHMFRLPSGQWFIKKSRDKSDIYSIIPLLTQAHEIIIKYGSVANLPKPDISDLNKALKILGEVCQAPFSISTSTFRETFSSMMENEYMIPDRLLMFMMGHTNPRQLKNYSAVMPARILHELNKNDISIPFNVEAFEELVKAS